MKYSSLLNPFETENAIKSVKDIFQYELSTRLHLHRLTAPLFVQSGLGLNDDLSGTERPVSFAIRCMGGAQAEIVHSLAKWKRVQLGHYAIPAGEGLYTDMSAIRTEEDLDALHSLYVDQWDWERTIRPEDRTSGFLRQIVLQIYQAIRGTEWQICDRYTQLHPFLPQDIHFITTEQLLQMYPSLSPKEREREITRQYGAVFLMNIGAPLSNGEPHDLRAADYDDWSLNGDLLVWYPVLECAVELSSMGIRVDKDAMLAQLHAANMDYKQSLYYHHLVLTGQIPLSIGGGIGQSRLCMVLLHKAHIGEVQASIWPQEMRKREKEAGINLI